MKHVKSPEEYYSEELLNEGVSFEILKNFKKVSKKIFDENVKSEVKRYVFGSKQEFKETGQYFRILYTRYKKGEKLTKEEKKFLLRQSVDILKIIGLVIPFQVLFPVPLPMVGTTILIILEYVFRKMGIKILPDAYYKDYKEPNLKKVEEFIEED